MVKLFVENSNLNSPVAAVRWCVDKNTVNKLKEWGVRFPFMLLVVAHEVGEGDDSWLNEVECKVVPLDQAMEYIEFHSPGKHRIFACLVWSDREKEIDAKRELFRYFSDRRNLFRNGEFVELTKYGNNELSKGSIDVVVPDEYFAKEPAEWEKWWVNLWFESKPVNQCHFRRRRLLAYSIQPLVVLAYILCRTLLSLAHILALLLIGARNIQYEPILHPFMYDRWDAAPKEISSVFLKNSAGEDRLDLYILCMPMVQLVLLALLLLVNWGLHKLGLSLGSVLLWLLAINVFLSLASITLSMLGGLDKLFPAETLEQRAARIKLEMERRYAEYQDILCSGVALQPSISALPSQRRTFYLRFMEFKSKVCLPFAR